MELFEFYVFQCCSYCVSLHELILFDLTNRYRRKSLQKQKYLNSVKVETNITQLYTYKNLVILLGILALSSSMQTLENLQYFITAFYGSAYISQFQCQNLGSKYITQAPVLKVGIGMPFLRIGLIVVACHYQYI